MKKFYKDATGNWRYGEETESEPKTIYSDHTLGIFENYKGPIAFNNNPFWFQAEASVGAGVVNVMQQLGYDINIEELFHALHYDQEQYRNGYLAGYNAAMMESVPKEWIKKWMRKSENTYIREPINEMLEDWERENERV